jgi:hypothetical protein
VSPSSAVTAPPVFFCTLTTTFIYFHSFYINDHQSIIIHLKLISHCCFGSHDVSSHLIAPSALGTLVNVAYFTVLFDPTQSCYDQTQVKAHPISIIALMETH